jgi:hypothetical protein
MASMLCIVLSKELSNAGNNTLYQPIFRASFLHTLCQNSPRYPTLLLCCLKPAHPHPNLMFLSKKSCQQKTSLCCIQRYKLSPMS